MSLYSAQVHRGLVFGLTAVFGFLVVFLLIWLGRPKDRADPLGNITYNLIQLSAAKEAWAKECGQTGVVEVAESNLVRYLWSGRAKGELVAPVRGERYRLNALGASPEALLARSVGKLPAGTIIRLNPTSTLPQEIILPSRR